MTPVGLLSPAHLGFQREQERRYHLGMVCELAFGQFDMGANSMFFCCPHQVFDVCVPVACLVAVDQGKGSLEVAGKFRHNLKDQVVQGFTVLRIDAAHDGVAECAPLFKLFPVAPVDEVAQQDLRFATDGVPLSSHQGKHNGAGGAFRRAGKESVCRLHIHFLLKLQDELRDGISYRSITRDREKITTMGAERVHDVHHRGIQLITHSVVRHPAQSWFCLNA